MFYFLSINLDTEIGKGYETRGTFKIISGAAYHPSLQDENSVDFKVLSFDLQEMVGEGTLLANLKF